MFAGHLAVALGAKRAAPDMPLGAFVAASFGLDLLWPVLLLAGVERVRIDAGNTAFTPLMFEHYPWSHSLLLAAVWAGVVSVATAAATRNRRGALVVGLTLLSHWFLDAVVHRPDLPVWPGGPTAGLGLWHSIPGTLLVEGALYVAAIALYLRSFAFRDTRARWAFWSLIGLVGVIWISGPWAPPPPAERAVAVVALAMWLFPPGAHLIDRRPAVIHR
jgi:membrane-bound metal-dependent hydrolase YbcI (DUF457 family)